MSILIRFGIDGPGLAGLIMDILNAPAHGKKELSIYKSYGLRYCG
jgi:hypothetical protein